MSEIKKPEIMSQRKKHLCNEFYRQLKSGICLKDNLNKEYRLDERISRDIITAVAKKFPVITPGKGYKIADSSTEDTLEVIHKIRDFDSRIAEFNERKAPLWEHLERKMKELSVVTLADLERKLQGGN